MAKEIAAMVFDGEALWGKPTIGIILVEGGGGITILNDFGNDKEVLEYARAGDFRGLACRLENNTATPEMQRLAGELLSGNLKRKKERPKSLMTYRERLLIAAGVGLLMHIGRSRKDAFYWVGEAFKCKTSKIEASIAKQPPLILVVCNINEWSSGVGGRQHLEATVQYQLVNKPYRQARVRQVPQETIDLNGATIH